MNNKEFKCDLCKNTYPKYGSDEEIIQEFKDNFFNLSPEKYDIAILCDDCYHRVMVYIKKKYPNMTKEKFEELYKLYE